VTFNPPNEPVVEEAETLMAAEGGRIVDEVAQHIRQEMAKYLAARQFLAEMANDSMSVEARALYVEAVEGSDTGLAKARRVLDMASAVHEIVTDDTEGMT
jgi:dsDNA-specific endonuclease/ATPase MutS2